MEWIYQRRKLRRETTVTVDLHQTRHTERGQGRSHAVEIDHNWRSILLSGQADGETPASSHKEARY